VKQGIWCKTRAAPATVTQADDSADAIKPLSSDGKVGVGGLMDPPVQPGDRPENIIHQLHAVGVLHGVTMFKFSLLATAVFSSLSYAAVADTTTSTVGNNTSNIEKISIYASRQAKPLADVNASVTVLDRADIELRQPKDVIALLQLVPGIQIARSGSRGQTSSLFIRGSRTQHTLVLIDGVRTGSATLGYQDLALLPIELIEKVEVIRGARAALYGSDAISGVIAITTRQLNRNELTAKTGSNGLAETSLHSTYKVADAQVFASVGYSRADGIHVRDKADADRDGFRQRFARLGASGDTELGFVEWTSQLNRGFNEYDADPTWGGADEAKSQQDLHQLQWRYPQTMGANQQITHQAHLAFSRDDSLNFGNNSAPSRYETARQELDYQASYALSSELNVLAGLSHINAEVESLSTAYTKKDRISNSVFVGSDAQFGDWSTDLVLRNDNVSAYGSNNSYQWGLAYQLIAPLQLRFNQGTGFKVPTFNALFWPKSGNPDLLPEESLSRELGLRYQGAFQLDVVHYRRDLTNMIVYNNVAKQSQNIGLAQVDGFEYSLSKTLAGVYHQLDLTYANPQDLSNNSAVPNIPKHKLTYLAAYQWDAWQFSGSLQQRARLRNAADTQTVLSSVLLVGAGVSYDWSRDVKVRLNLDNLLDKTYQTNLGYLQPGREFSLAVQVLNF
jgi:vitamin B12 transporter